MSGRVYEPDFEPTRRHYRESPSGGSKGSGFDLGKGGGGTVPTNRGGLGNQDTSPSTPKQDDPQRKEPARGSDKNPNAKGLGSKAVDKGLEQVAKKGSGTIVGEGANLASAAKRARDEGAGAGAQAAETAAAGIRAGASATGVGGAVVKGYDAVKKALGVVGIKIKDRYVVYILLFGVFLSVLPVIIFFLVIFFAWDNPRAVLSLGWTGLKAGIGALVSTTIEDGGAGKMAYEVDKGSGAIAAPAGANAPEQGTLEYKLAQIDWEKAKYQTLQPNNDRCEVKTKKVVSVLDGKERSVIDSVQLKTDPGKELEGVARANCINNVYPIFQTTMRSQFVRDNLNAKLSVRFAYAEPTDSQVLKGSPTEIQKSLRDKTLNRIWLKSGSYQLGQQSPPEEVAARNAEILQHFGTLDGEPIRTIGTYTDTKYTQTIRDCANNYIPEPRDLQNFYDKDVVKMANDLRCGIEPKDLKLYVSLPDDSLINSSNPDIAIRPKRAALNVICDLYNKLLKDDPANPGDPNNPTERYRQKVKDRIDSAAAASWQAVTYADTNRARFLNIQELNKDFYKIAGMQSGQEYNYTLDGRTSGTPLESDAVSRIVGFYNIKGFQLSADEVEYQKALQAIFDSMSKPYQVGSTSVTICDIVANQNIAGIPGTASLSNNIVNVWYAAVYGQFKKAVAGLDFYARPNNSQSISQIYNNITAEDVLFRMIRLESNTATAGTEDGPQNFNRMNFGMKAYMNAVSLSMGGKFLTDNEALARDANVQVAQEYDQQTRGLAYRFFSFDNPGSFSSRLRVAFTDRPQKVAGNVASMLGGILSPIRNAAGEKGTLTAMLTGHSRVALAASVYDKQNLKLDPAGIPESMTTQDMIQNARFIEGLKKSGNQDVLTKFSNWDQCFKEFIPSRFHLLYPSADKKDLYEKYCQPLLDSTNGGPRSDPNSLESRYAAYHFANLQADALVYLSNPDQEDISLDAISSNQQGAANPNTAGTPQTPQTPIASGQDTSALQCPAGTTDAGIGEKYGVGRVLQYRIRLCNVQGITVNVSVAANLNNLLNAAKAAGIKFGGGGYRTYDEQVALRTKNGCPNVYTAPSGSCRTPTAIPGQSNHESGEAVDFTQNGATLTRGSSGFNWMKANANAYQFFNLPSEAWHWSKDGK